MADPWVFMGVDRSHFSAKLRPVVRYKQLHYVEYPPDMQEIVARTGVGFVPVLQTPEGEMLQDTTDIIDVLEQRVPAPAILPGDPADMVVARLVELYADEFFPTVSMRTRWAYPENERELRRAFAAFSGSVEQGNNVADLMSSYLPMLGVTAETLPAIDAHTADILAALDAHFAEYPFLLGARMSLADCALMGPLYAHLYLDRVTRKQLYDDALHVCMWIERCNRPVPESMGDWFDGEYPATLQKILSLIGADAAPMLIAQRAAFGTWADEHASSGQEVPRAIGTYRSALRGTDVQAGVRGYVTWKMQRVADTFASLQPAGQERVGEIIAACGCSTLLTQSSSPRLVKRGFQLTFA